MKKILLIGLLALVFVFGVFGANPDPAKLTLETNITAVNRIAITKATVTDYNFTGTDKTEVTYNLKNAFGKSGGNAETAANLHYKTNNAKKVSVKMSGTVLKSSENHVIPYKLYYGDAYYTNPYIKRGCGDDIGTTLIVSYNDGTPMVKVSKKLTVVIDEGNTSQDDYPAGDYAATITFTLTAL